MGDAGFPFITPPGSSSGTLSIRKPSITSPSTSDQSRTSQRSGSRSPFTNRSDKSLRDLAGHWMLNPSLSSTNTTFNDVTHSPPSNITITQSHYPSQIFVKFFPSPESRFQSTERWFPPQKPGQWSDWNTDFEGTRSRSRWVRGDQFEQKDGIEFLTHGLSRLGEFFEAEIEGRGGKWRMGQVWFVQRGSQLVRRFVRFDEGEEEDEEERSEREDVWEFVRT
ncbi:uncharacterized protein MYCFIDRAFT_211002 [Pseudocercospora fijiensis CIRAD86]|uniref:Uncharacterized protein n=1 Tax=Pseudocercospora fijiensis (strain CIRAD86) TaxID=383855 RepID=M3AJY0_PSEFD|nr:uncharacterized protein MYCFIDRAFT_211002 [Pseudocercospora fijiensis CIRAD86]EME84881.1 hypothetical protein MYCFIDRAFT_211002 [Pseudocercospora fijiensis CIRAD86]